MSNLPDEPFVETAHFQDCNRPTCTAGQSEHVRLDQPGDVEKLHHAMISIGWCAYVCRHSKSNFDSHKKN